MKNSRFGMAVATANSVAVWFTLNVQRKLKQQTEKQEYAEHAISTEPTTRHY